MEGKFTESFWTERYVKEETGWDIGHASTPIAAYIDQLENRDLNIIIPGAGNAHEAEYLFKASFPNVHVLDLSREPLENLSNRLPGFPESQLIHSNFFEFKPCEDHPGFDLMIEQTFFCALDPALRQQYADQAFRLLKPGGKIAGLYFSFPLEEGLDSPPFGGSLEEYRSYFSAFDILTFEPCYNSIEPRQGREFFAILQKPL